MPTFETLTFIISVVAATLACASLWITRKNYLDTRRRYAEQMGIEIDDTLRGEIHDVFTDPLRQATRRIRGGGREAS